MSEIPELICRICEQQTKELTNITMPQNWVLITQYLACANVTFDVMDKLPKYFCETCVINLNSAYIFKRQCEFTQKKFYYLLNRTLTQDYLKLLPVPLPEDLLNDQQIKQDVDNLNSYLNVQLPQLSTVQENSLFMPIKQEPGLDIDDDVKPHQSTKKFKHTNNDESFDRTNSSCSNKSIVEDEKFTTENVEIDLSAKEFKQSSSNKKEVQKINLSSNKPTAAASFNKKPSIYKCDKCEKQFRQSGDLKRHTIVHSDVLIRPFKCDLCEATFRQSSNLNKHRRIHSGERPFQCTLCETKFRNSGSLTTHMRIHTGERPFKCTFCGGTFRQSGCLTKHMRMHTDNRPFPCTLCTAKFRQSYDLKLHMRIHTGERPFQCDVCKTEFRHKASLVEHMNLHTGKWKFQCPHCDKKFKQNSTLRGHIQTHNPLKCNLCPREYGSKSKLSYHQRTKHNK